MTRTMLHKGYLSSLYLLQTAKVPASGWAALRPRASNEFSSTTKERTRENMLHSESKVRKALQTLWLI